MTKDVNLTVFDYRRSTLNCDRTIAQVRRFEIFDMQVRDCSWRHALRLLRQADFQKTRDLPGAIVLAFSGNDDELLTSSEILDLKLNAELVVLSACNTGREKLTGDGVLGLFRALISAEVHSILVLLRSVPDAATAELMAELYR